MSSSSDWKVVLLDMFRPLSSEARAGKLAGALRVILLLKALGQSENLSSKWCWRLVYNSLWLLQILGRFSSRRLEGSFSTLQWSAWRRPGKSSKRWRSLEQVTETLFPASLRNLRPRRGCVWWCPRGGRPSSWREAPRSWPTSIIVVGEQDHGRFPGRDVRGWERSPPGAGGGGGGELSPWLYPL